MSTTLQGLTLHPATPAYLKEAYGLDRIEEVEGVPIFSDAQGRQYAGGYDNLYTVVEGNAQPVTDSIERWQGGKRYVRYAFSTVDDLFGAKRRHYLLSVPNGTGVDGRLALYWAKTRNQVRKSLALIDDVREGSRDRSFYDLYYRTVRRLHGVPRPLAWFERFDAYFGKDVHTVNAYHEGALVGANYYVRSGDYTLLLANVSHEEYWHLDINNRLYDAYISSAIAQGVRSIDFGPGLAADVSHAHFKQGFGGTERYMADRLYAPLTTRIKEALSNRLTRYFRRARRA